MLSLSFLFFVFFFFKQKTAYDIRLSLVGSEMCIRDSLTDQGLQIHGRDLLLPIRQVLEAPESFIQLLCREDDPQFSQPTLQCVSTGVFTQDNIRVRQTNILGMHNLEGGPLF